jgi:hypothetical protein
MVHPSRHCVIDWHSPSLNAGVLVTEAGRSDQTERSGSLHEKSGLRLLESWIKEKRQRAWWSHTSHFSLVTGHFVEGQSQTVMRLLHCLRNSKKATICPLFLLSTPKEKPVPLL